jgi:lauroyl/myristoyl acyltransferase
VVAGSNPVAPTIFLPFIARSAKIKPSMLAVLFYKLGAFLTCRLPERVSASIAASLGYIQYYMRFRTRRNISRNLELIFGDALDGRMRRQTSRAVFKNFAECIRLFLKLPWIDPEQFAKDGDFSGFDEVLDKLEPGRGFIIVSAHLGPWELGALHLKSRNIQMHTAALDHPSRQTTAFFNDRRTYVNTASYPLDGSFTKLKKALDRGECVVLLIDRDFKTTNKQFTFFGVQASLPNSHLLLAAKCRVPLVPGAFLLRPGGGFKGIFRGPYEISDQPDRMAAMNEAQMRCLGDLEDLIRAHPEQYFHFDPLET